jgi:outer membrane protein OmpA-like peptidoglycan-associated protein
MARVGFRLTRPFETENGMRFTPYLKGNLLQEIGGSSDVHLSGVAFGTGTVGTELQVGGGVTATLTRQLSLYGDVAWQSQVGNAGGFRGWVFNGGLRYAFGAPPPPPPSPVAAPARAASRSYLVFFDWDKATLTDRARQIVADAATASRSVQYTRIEVNGYTDTSGTPRYNHDLSVRRAQAVASELVRNGVPAGAITIQGFGETHLLVPTGDGVREPQNRRVEIILD